MSVRIYGRAVGNGSLSVVTAGFKEAIEGAGLLEGLVALDKSGGDEESEGPPGALAKHGVFTGNLQFVPLMRRGARHEYHWVQVTPNSDYIPRNLLAAIVELPNPRILSASKWGACVIRDALLRMGVGYSIRYTDGLEHSTGTQRSVEIVTVGHGVSGFAPVLEELESTRADFDKGEFRVIHFSTTDGERKGTLELIQAWQLLEHMLPGQPELNLVMDYHAGVALQDRLQALGIALPDTVRLLPRGDMNADAMSRVLCRMHLVAAPSRGEGFGLLPLQARACGVPVVATLTTGHSAGHLPPEHVTRIRQDEELAPIDDGPGAAAPAVLPAEIAQAVAFAHAHWRDLSLNAQALAPDVIRDWSWKAQLAPLVELLK